MSTALLLAAGKATRLEGIRTQYAKATVPVGNTTPLRFMLERLAAAAVEDVWINLHYLGEQVREAAQRWASASMRLHFLVEEQLLGTGGTLLAVAQQLGCLPDIVVNAKMFTDFDFARLLDSDAASKHPTMVLHPPTNLADFGGLAYDQNLQIRHLHSRDSEPPRPPCDAAVFTGIARPDPAWIPFLAQARAEDPARTICSIRDGLLPAIEAGTSSARALLWNGYWYEISTPQRVARIRAEMPDLLG